MCVISNGAYYSSICVGNLVNTNEFRDIIMATSDVLKVQKYARAVCECIFRTFRTSPVSINQEVHEQVHTIFQIKQTTILY